jgi:hypothetical protein
MPTVRQILDRRTSIPKVLFVLRAATVPRSTEIRPLGFDWVNLLYKSRLAGVATHADFHPPNVGDCGGCNPRRFPPIQRRTGILNPTSNPPEVGLGFPIPLTWGWDSHHGEYHVLALSAPLPPKISTGGSVCSWPRAFGNFYPSRLPPAES